MGMVAARKRAGEERGCETVEEACRSAPALPSGLHPLAERGPSCVLLGYFYMNAILVVLLLWAVLNNLALSNWVYYVQQNWGE